METIASKRPASEERRGDKPRKGTAGAHKALITRNLRLAFGEVAGEPVPDRFLDLLDKLDKTSERSS